jgi:hypothetical protein
MGKNMYGMKPSKLGQLYELFNNFMTFYSSSVFLNCNLANAPILITFNLTGFSLQSPHFGGFFI